MSVCYSLSCVQLFATPWTVTQQSPLSMEFSRQEYWSAFRSLFQGSFPADSLPSELTGKPSFLSTLSKNEQFDYKDFVQIMHELLKQTDF